MVGLSFVCAVRDKAPAKKNDAKNIFILSESCKSSLHLAFTVTNEVD